MHTFDYRFLKEMSVSPDIVQRLSRLEGFRQRSFFMREDKDDVLIGMENIALAMSVRESNAIEGIRTTDDRLYPLISGTTAPKGHSEEEIAGYRDALRYIHENHEKITLSRESILDIYHMLTAYSGYEEIGFKKRDNIIVERDADGSVTGYHETVPAEMTERAVDEMILSYIEARDDRDINKLLLIPCFIMDFLRIHPFEDGNGRMSRLLTTLLLYHEGFDVCRYVSMESKINASKIDYYRSLEQSEIGWFENECDYTYFIEYFLGCLFLSYKEFDRRMAQSADVKGKTDRVTELVLNVNLPISKKEILEMFPDVSATTVERTLSELLKNGKIKKMGSTKNSRYVRNDHD